MPPTATSSAAARINSNRSHRRRRPRRSPRYRAAARPRADEGASIRRGETAANAHWMPPTPRECRGCRRKAPFASGFWGCPLKSSLMTFVGGWVGRSSLSSRQWRGALPQAGRALKRRWRLRRNPHAGNLRLTAAASSAPWRPGPPRDQASFRRLRWCDPFALPGVEKASPSLARCVAGPSRLGDLTSTASLRRAQPGAAFAGAPMTPVWARHPHIRTV
jgi:hypothetical protein